MNRPFIITAARCGDDVEVIRVLVKYGADINEQCEGGETALHKAARCGRDDIVTALLQEFQADPLLSLVNGSIPIHTAANWNSTKCMELLVQAGSDINARNKTGRTPLHWAADSGAEGVVRMLEAEFWRKEERAKVLEIFAVGSK